MYVEKQAIAVYKNVLTEDLKHLRLSQQNMIRNLNQIRLAIQ